MSMAEQQGPRDGAAPAVDRDNLTYLADALGSAMAERQTSRLVLEAAGGDAARARELLAEVVAEALERHGRVPESLATLPDEVARLRSQAAGLRDGLAESARRLDALAEGQARQHDALVEGIERVERSLAGVSTRTSDLLAKELGSIDDRIARLAESNRALAQKRSGPGGLALALVALLAALLGLGVGAALVAASPEVLPESLRSAIAGLFGTG